MWEQILRKAFESEDPIIVNELIKDSNYKVKGDESLDLYIYTDKQYLVQKFKSNIIKIREYTSKSEGKHINQIYINNVRHEVTIEKLNSKQDINIIDIDYLGLDDTADLSGENDIINTLFEYEESVLQKQKVTLHLHQKESKKEFLQEINMSIVRSKFSFKKNSLIKKLELLLSMRYVPITNDTKEVIEILKIKQ